MALKKIEYRMIRVIASEYTDNYRLKLTFEDGKQKIVDLKDMLYGEMFEPLKDINYFRQVKADIELGTICWPNGADISPETLYEIGYD